MSVSLLRQGTTLIASLPGGVRDLELDQLLDELSARIGEVRARGVILDVSRVEVIDSYGARMLRSIVQVARLRGADTVVVGIHPEVAYAMVQLGVTLGTTPTALDLEEGLDLLAARRHEGRDRWPTRPTSGSGRTRTS